MKILIALSVLSTITAKDFYLPPYKPNSSEELCNLLNWTVTQNQECLVAMIDKGNPGVWARSSQCANMNTTPLHVVAATENRDVLRLLLAMGAPLEARDSMGYTPLHSAANSSNSKAVADLLFAGADVNATDNNGDTPLHLAVRRYVTTPKNAHHSWDTYNRVWNRIILLLSAGADRGIVNKLGQSPLSMVLGKDDKLTLLLLGLSELKNLFPDSICSGHQGIYRRGQESGVNSVVNGTDWCGRTVLHLSVINGVSTFTVTNTTDVNARDVTGRTPLHEAARRGRLAMVRELLAARADVDAADWLGFTPLHMASLCGMNDVRKELLIARAATTLRDRRGRTAQDLIDGVLFPPRVNGTAVTPANGTAVTPANGQL